MKIKAQAEAEIEAIETERLILKKQAEQKMEDIQNQIYRERERTKADSQHYQRIKEIEAEQQ